MNATLTVTSGSAKGKTHEVTNRTAADIWTDWYAGRGCATRLTAQSFLDEPRDTISGKTRAELYADAGLPATGAAPTIEQLVEATNEADRQAHLADRAARAGIEPIQGIETFTGADILRALHNDGIIEIHDDPANDDAQMAFEDERAAEQPTAAEARYAELEGLGIRDLRQKAKGIKGAFSLRKPALITAIMESEGF